MPIYEEKEKVNGQKRYYIRTYVTDEYGNRKQVTRHNKNWVGRDGYWLAYNEENVLKSKIITSDENMNLNNLIDDFLDYKRKSVEITTYNLYVQIINLYIKKYFNCNKKIREFTNNDVLNWKAKINSLDFSIKFKKDIYVIAKLIFDYGEKRIYFNNPFNKIENFQITKKDIKLDMNILTEEQFKLFIIQETNNIYKLFFLILFYMGLRKGECLALKKENIDLDKKTLSINQTYNTNYKIETLPKTIKSKRTLLMPEIVFNEIKNVIANTNDDDTYIFKNIVKATTLREKCQRNLKKANITQHIRIHDFRHSFASMCVQKNVPIHIISEYMGHKDIYTTLKTYAHLYPNSQKILIDILNS